MKKRYSAWILIGALMISSCGLDLGTENPQQKPGEGQVSENPSGSVDNSEDDDSESVDDSEKPEEPSTPGDSEDSDTENKYTYTDMNKTMWSKTSLNVRSEPSKIGEVIGYLAPNEEVKVILTALKRQQLAELKELVAGIDPDAFIIVQEAHQVLGEGFRRYSKDEL